MAVPRFSPPSSFSYCDSIQSRNDPTVFISHNHRAMMSKHLNHQKEAKESLPTTLNSNIISKKDESNVMSSNCSWRNPKDDNLRRGMLFLL